MAVGSLLSYLNLVYRTNKNIRKRTSCLPAQHCSGKDTTSTRLTSRSLRPAAAAGFGHKELGSGGSPRADPAESFLAGARAAGSAPAAAAAEPRARPRASSRSPSRGRGRAARAGPPSDSHPPINARNSPSGSRPASRPQTPNPDRVNRLRTEHPELGGGDVRN